MAASVAHFRESTPAHHYLTQSSIYVTLALILFPSEGYNPWPTRISLPA